MSRSSRNSSGPNRTRADAFLEEHKDFLSYADTTLPPNTEFPICLEDITEHICVKIVDIDECTHMIGLECLHIMLENYPNEQKLCPLCRTEWLPAARRIGHMARNADDQAEVLVRIPVDVPVGSRAAAQNHGTFQASRPAGPPLARTPNPARPARTSSPDLLNYVTRFPAPARSASPYLQSSLAYYAASYGRRIPATAGAPWTSDILRNPRTQRILPTPRHGPAQGTLRGLRSHGFGHFPHLPEYGDHFDDYYYRSRWGYDCLYCIDRGDHYHGDVEALPSRGNDNRSDHHCTNGRDQTPPRRDETDISFYQLPSDEIVGREDWPFDFDSPGTSRRPNSNSLYSPYAYGGEYRGGYF
jgi:hypothetical protein